MPRKALLKTTIPGMTPRRGKVRDIYDRGGSLLIITTDRISAFDWVFPNGIPDKGRVLTKLSEFWLQTLVDKTPVMDHLLTTDLNAINFPDDFDATPYSGYCMEVEKAEPVLFECVVRGYLAGSGLKDYRRSGSVCGITLPTGLRESDKLPEPIFTPATKAQSGHDINVSFQHMCDEIGTELATWLKERSVEIYQTGAEFALERGIIIADTKFEFGHWDDDHPILIDEVLTPDSSRFWPLEGYEPGKSQPSFDKQFVRDWVEATGWDKKSEPPPLPQHIINGTRSRYIEAFELLTGQSFPWK